MIASGQISLFDAFCWDDDINCLHASLIAFAEKWGMEYSADWQIWDHVPQYGYRMTFNFHFPRMESEKETSAVADLMEICKDAKKRQIDLSAIWDGEHYLYHDAVANGWSTKGYERDGMSVYSTFNDKRRRKIR